MLDLDWSYHTSTIRLRSEISSAVKCVEKFSPALLMLDGSIIPHYSDKPARSSSVFDMYMEVLGLYLELFGKCEKTGTMLCGVVEDSRSSRFCELLKKIMEMERGGGEFSVLERTKDTNLLYWALQKGERTMEFRYSDSPKEHPVLKDFGDYWEKIHGFYLKTAKWDRPVRVEFISEKPAELAGKLAPLILAVSGQHEVYGLPTPLIEADSVAKMSDLDIDQFYSQILSITGNIPSMFRLRREQRPF